MVQPAGCAPGAAGPFEPQVGSGFGNVGELVANCRWCRDVFLDTGSVEGCRCQQCPVAADFLTEVDFQPIAARSAEVFSPFLGCVCPRVDHVAQLVEVNRGFELGPCPWAQVGANVPGNGCFGLEVGVEDIGRRCSRKGAVQLERCRGTESLADAAAQGHRVVYTVVQSQLGADGALAVTRQPDHGFCDSSAVQVIVAAAGFPRVPAQARRDRERVGDRDLVLYEQADAAGLASAKFSVADFGIDVAPVAQAVIRDVHFFVADGCARDHHVLVQGAECVLHIPVNGAVGAAAHAARGSVQVFTQGIAATGRVDIPVGMRAQQADVRAQPARASGGFQTALEQVGDAFAGPQVVVVVAAASREVAGSTVGEDFRAGARIAQIGDWRAIFVFVLVAAKTQPPLAVIGQVECGPQGDAAFAPLVGAGFPDHILGGASDRGACVATDGSCRAGLHLRQGGAVTDRIGATE